MSNNIKNIMIRNYLLKKGIFKKPCEKKCLDEKCETKNPSFNYLSENEGCYCIKHKKENMYNVVSKECQFDGCFLKANHGFEEFMKPIFCFDHKKKDMIFIDPIEFENKCKKSNCKKKCEYNFYDKSKPIFCFEHKTDDMINFLDNSCQEIGCNSLPEYNFEDKYWANYCFAHKKNNMIKCTARKCQEYGCTKKSTHGFNNDDLPIYCLEHKKDGMIIFNTHRCSEKDCNNLAKYNFEGVFKKYYCFDHKKDGMICAFEDKCCEPFCYNNANYNFKNQKKGMYCIEHRPLDAVNILAKICKNNWCITSVSPESKNDGYCINCFMHLFPDKPTSKNFKTRESAVVRFVKTNFLGFDWIFDKKVLDGYSKRRPDIYLDLGYQIIIIEVDENKHEKFDCSCENKRMIELSQDFNHRPIIFIRFNPDEYLKNGKLINSCWTKTKKINNVAVKMKYNWEKRLNSLKSLIEYWTNPKNKTDKTVEIIHLFYDC